MPSGTAKWFDYVECFDLMAPRFGGEDAFVHPSTVGRARLTDIADDRLVTFDLDARRGGRGSATNPALA